MWRARRKSRPHGWQAPSSGDSRPSSGWRRGSSVRSTARASSSSSVAMWELARRRWSILPGPPGRWERRADRAGTVRRALWGGRTLAAAGPARGAVDAARREEARVARLPEEVGQLLTRRLAALPAAARRVLEVASVVGQEFAVAAVRPARMVAVDDVEGICDELAAHGRFIADTRLTVWPDGMSSGRYGFTMPCTTRCCTGAGDGAAGAAAPPGGGPPGGRVWRPGGGGRGPAAVHFERGGVVQRAGTIGSRREPMPPGAMPIMRRSPPSPGARVAGALPESPARLRRLTLLLSLGNC